MSNEFFKDIKPRKRNPEEEAKIEAILTASLKTEPGLDRLATAMTGRYKRLIFGYKCNDCGSEEVYRQGAVSWGPNGGYYQCGQCKQTADLYQSISRSFLKTYKIEDDGTETLQEPITIDKKSGFTPYLSDKNCGKSLRRWLQTGRNPEVWEELEVPIKERPTKKVWNKFKGSKK